MAGDHAMAEPKGCNTIGAVTFFWGLIGGTGTSLSIKILYQLTSTNIDGEVAYFEKPMFLTAVMFLAMTMALPAFAVIQWCKKPEDRDQIPVRVLGWLILPSIFDLAGTNLAQIGLVYTTVSYFQLLRCTVIIVTAFLKAFVLKHHLQAYMWWGVAINILAMVLVSLTSFLAPPDVQPNGSNNPALGSFFILLSCIVQGSQYIFEEKVMAVDNAPPLVVIGMEGFWGTVIMVILFPVSRLQ
jgi:drug/metabolite transporter (DMT)-like permease